MTTQEAIEHFDGNASELARRLGITRGAVSGWGEYPPPGRQYQIQILTGGELVAENQAQEAEAS